MICDTPSSDQHEARVPKAADHIVFIVDDDPDLCRSLAWLLDGCGIRTETFASAESFLAADYNPAGCLLLDVRMPGMNGLELQRRLRDLPSWLAIVVMSGHADVGMAVQALEGGAVTFLEKPFTRERLLFCLDEAWAKAEEHAVQIRTQAEDQQRIAHLTPRERQVFDMVVAGAPTKNIARTLEVSTRTVDKHRERILAKTGIESWAELVALGVRLRMFPSASQTSGEGGRLAQQSEVERLANNGHRIAS